MGRIGFDDFDKLAAPKKSEAVGKALADQLDEIAFAEFPSGQKPARRQRLAKAVNDDIINKHQFVTQKYTLQQREYWIRGDGDGPCFVATYYWMHLRYPKHARKVDEIADRNPGEPLLFLVELR